MTDEKKIQEEAKINDGTMALNLISWLFGIVFFAIGVVNTFWGDDPGFGVFIILLSLAFFLPVPALLKKIVGLSISASGMRIIKILLGLFIIWASVGVGELFDKIELMMNTLK